MLFTLTVRYAIISCSFQLIGQFCSDDVDGDFAALLSTIADRVTLKGFRRYRGGLDTKNDTTGTHSYFVVHRGNEVMLHVGPMLPFFEADVQQVERKRHIGNDIVVLIYNESNAPFNPAVLTSHFNHVFCVVSPAPAAANGAKQFRIAFVVKPGVRPFGPFLPEPPVFVLG